MLLVVVAHSAMAYVRVWPPRLLWAIRDPSRAMAFDALFWASVSVAMPAFFLLSGFFAARLYETRGPDEFVRDRGRRIVGPFLLGAATILPPSLVVWARLAREWPLHAPAVARDEVPRRDHQVQLVGPAHLWFLEYLILMLAAYWAVRAARRGSAAIGGLAAIFGGRLAPVLLAVPTALILWAGHARLGLDAVADLRNSFLPDPFRWAHHAWFFVVGVALSRRRHDLEASFSGAGWWLGLSALAFLVRAWLLGQDLLIPLHGARAVALAVSGALFGWLAFFGLMGLFLRWPVVHRPWVRSLSESSYWIYLVHFPITGLAQVALEGAPVPCGAKFAVVLAASLFVGLASDRVLVRRTRLGRWLHGSTRPGNPALEGSSRHATACPSRPVGLG